MKFLKPIELFQQILKANAVENKRLLGLDIGSKYVGLAISDSRIKVANPLSVLVRRKTNTELMARDLQTLVSELSLGGIIIGYPLDSINSSSPGAERIKLFVEDLNQTGKLDDLSYTYWDERYTSKSCETLLRHLNIHPVEQKTILDKFAAVEILQRYLDHVRRTPKLED
ncbi:hypothetical protein QJS10_CPA02g00358 [Acorus calamus]|uniref:YqgF/RNase H-like domain-containing protein n=1 Tax=Acorus calamus TaxID=4465 RepID=A0AAV9FDS1_ACOCL|nr:hypothetical protein QJS10_CPA02g00358 [Acorus calamus]